MLILFDWDGTIARKEVAEEAAQRRLRILGVKKSAEWMRKAQKTHAHYDVTKAAISAYTGIKNERELTIMMTDLFHIHYLGVVNEWGKKGVLYQGMHQALERVKDKYGLKYAIVTTLRQDIVEPATHQLGINHLFDGIFGNTPSLDYSKTDLARQAAKKLGRPFLIVGDRKDDLLAGKEVGAKSAYAIWGHGFDEDAKLADYVLKTPADLGKIVEGLLKR